jgi:UDP-N-acetyl-D-glucosamine dehydrogenase
MIDDKKQLLDRLATRGSRVGVVGLGYVGLPLAMTLADAGYQVTGIDSDRSRVEAIRRGETYIPDVDATALAQAVRSGKITATSSFRAVEHCHAVSICVPTPLGKTGDPDISHIVSAAEQIALYLQPGSVVVLESTTYPGTTCEVVLPILEEVGSGRTVGESLFLAFSPERVDPSNPTWTTRTIPKVIGGVTAACLEVALAYYGPAIETLVPVSSPEIAEMAKLLENTFRAVNIALANEVLLMCDRLGLDVWEVIEAAATKPFGFMKFTPGPGLGGHCIPIDPLYLSWRLKRSSYNPRFIGLASEINASMPLYWTQRIQDALNDAGKAIRGSKILVLGVAYKRDVSDTRESSAIDIMDMLRAKGGDVTYHDPYVPTVVSEELRLESVHDLWAAVAASDCVVVATDHSCFDWDELARQARLIVDTRRYPRQYKTQGVGTLAWSDSAPRAV